MNMLNSAKKFAMKNKEKIAAGVDKATDAIDKKTGGKYHDKLEKVDDASAKFAGKPREASAAATATAGADTSTPGEETKAQMTETKPATGADST